MPFKQVRELEIHYRTLGGGHPLLLLHGLGGSQADWDPVFLGDLASVCLVVAFDNRGSGRTGLPSDAPFTIEEMALDAVGLMDALGIGRAHVLGHSLGGMIAQSIALDHPDRVDRLVLASTSCGGLQCIQPEKSIAELFTERTGTPEEYACRYVSALFPKWWYDEHREYVDRLTRSYLEQMDDRKETAGQFMAAAAFDSCRRLGEIRSPTLILTGTEDEVVPPRNSWIMPGRMNGAKLVEFPGAGHGFISQEPHKSARVILDFLES